MGRMKMGMAQKIRIILLLKGMTIKELASRLGVSGSNISNKLRRDNFSEKELHQIAEALGCDYDGVFTMRDTGEQI